MSQIPNQLSQRALSIADNYWAQELDCPSRELFSKPFAIKTHGAALADYDGVFSLFRNGSAVVSLPPQRADSLRGLLKPLADGCTPQTLINALTPVAARVIGPAFIGYAEAVTHETHQARAVEPSDQPAIEALQHACDETEWAHGGSSPSHPCSAVFINGQIAALAGYEVWNGNIAHISIITHPDLRGQGYGRNAVAHLARRVLESGLLPQYRTLCGNKSSIHIAETLGFIIYAESIAVRLT